MSKKNTKPQKWSPYRKYGFDRTMANDWNYECYKYWCLCDEGREKPPSQRETNFSFKYGRNNKITGRSILSYIPKKNIDKMIEWIAMTSSEKKNVRNIAQKEFKYNIGKTITHWLHQAEIMYFEDIRKS